MSGKQQEQQSFSPPFVMAKILMTHFGIFAIFRMYLVKKQQWLCN